MWLWCDHFATTKTDNRKEVSKVLGRFYWSRHKVSNSRKTKSIACSLLSTHKRLASADLVAQRFYWSLRGCEAVLFSSQIGFRLYGDKFHLEKGGYVLQTSSNQSVIDQRWGGDQSALQQRLVADWLQNGFQACANHMAMCLQYVADSTFLKNSQNYSPIIKALFGFHSKRISNFPIPCRHIRRAGKHKASSW